MGGNLVLQNQRLSAKMKSSKKIRLCSLSALSSVYTSVLRVAA